MYTSPVPALVTHICVLLRTKESKLSIEMMNIQKQPNGSDCGLYAIANALAICMGKNPCKIKWTNSLMRSHFRSCLETRKLTMFPAASEQRKFKDEVTKNYEFILVGCWRPGRRWRNVENMENGSTMIVKTFLKLFFQRRRSVYGFAVLALKLLFQIFLSS